jgi:hypothetical protein
MTGKALNTEQGEAQTPWHRRTASFQAAVQSGWRSYRLVPWLFKHAGRIEPVDTTPDAFGGAQLYPTTEFSLEQGLGIDGLGKEWGEAIAQGETAALIGKLAQFGENHDGTGALAHDLYAALARVGASDTVAILAPSRGQLFRQLDLARPGDLSWLPGVGARSLMRGTFEGIRVFAAQPADGIDLWVVDFSSVGWWQYAGQFDALATHAELLRDRFVPWNGTRDLATQIAAEEFFTIALDDPRAARGLRVPLDSVA